LLFEVGTINLVLLIVLIFLTVLIRGFVREAESHSSEKKEKFLHPLLDFDQIRAIPSLRDIEILLLSVALLLILYFVSAVHGEVVILAEKYAHWWILLEGTGVLVFCHALLKYTRHMVEPDRDDWRRAYGATHDFRIFRYSSASIILLIAAYFFWGFPSFEFVPGESGDDDLFSSTIRNPTLPGADRGREPAGGGLEAYWAPLMFLRGWLFLVFVYVLNWVLRLRGELVTLLKSIGLVLLLSGLIGMWNVAFRFDPDPESWLQSKDWAFSQSHHLCYTIAFLLLILLLFKDNMVLLGATHRAAQIIAEEKKVMVDFLVQVAEDTSYLTTSKPSDRKLRQDLDYILKLTLDFALKQSGAKAGAIYLSDTILRGVVTGTGHVTKLVPRVVEGPYPPLQPLTIDYLETRIKFINDIVLSDSLDLKEYPFFDQLVREGEILFLPDTEGRTDIPQQPTDFLRIHTLIAVPLRVQDQTLGLLMVINKFSESDRGWEPFTPQDASLINAVADQAAIAIANARMHEVINERERIEREMEIARTVQESLLPESCPQLENYEIQSYRRAAAQIGGDYFDFAWMGKNRLAIVVADVAGKGIPGALTMATLRSALRAQVDERLSARELVLNLNEFIFDDLKRDVFISLVLAVLDLEKGILSIVRAGHEPTLYWRKNSHIAEQILPDGMALGLDRGSLFRNSLEEFTHVLEPGDLFLFFTDGVTEAMNQEGEEFSLSRVSRLLEDSNLDFEVGAFVALLRDNLEAFTGDSPQHDDVTFVALQRK
jgi:serine phosphatase RsbU (regulator of sigma subunit)